MSWFRKEEKREVILDPVLKAIIANTEIDKEKALNIPTVKGCTELISNTVATIPIKLYKETNGEVEEVTGDSRTKLLNEETGDLLDSFQFKKALVNDYLLLGSGYAYINKERNKVKSLHYVEKGCVSTNVGTDHIFKTASVMVDGTPYRPFEFIKLLRNTQNGVAGKGIIDENASILSVAYNTLIFEEGLVKTGGNKKGFLKAKSKLTKEVMDSLKAAWKTLYSNNAENVMVLNEGIEFQEASNTLVEMQLNENKDANSTEICRIINVPPGILKGTASEQEYSNWIKICILPILKALETALNKDLLLETEKESFYFVCDTKELLKGDIEKRYKAYELAVKNNILQIDEIRYMEDLKPLGLDFIKLGLEDVLYYPKTKEVYTPNTNKTTKITDLRGGEHIEN